MNLLIQMVKSQNMKFNSLFLAPNCESPVQETAKALSMLFRTKIY